VADPGKRCKGCAPAEGHFFDIVFLKDSQNIGVYVIVHHPEDDAAPPENNRGSILGAHALVRLGFF